MLFRRRDAFPPPQPDGKVADRSGIYIRRLYQLVEKAKRHHKAALSGTLEEVAYWREVEVLVRQNGRGT